MDGSTSGHEAGAAGRTSRRPDARRGARIPQQRPVCIEPRLPGLLAGRHPRLRPDARTAGQGGHGSDAGRLRHRPRCREARLVWSRRWKPRRDLPGHSDRRPAGRIHGELRRALPGGLRRPGLLPVRVAAIDRGRERPLRVLPRRRLARVHRWRGRRDRGQLQADRPGRAQLLPLPAGRGRVDPDLDWSGGRRRWVPGQRGLPLRQPDRRRHLGVLLFQATTRGRRHRRGAGSVHEQERGHLPDLDRPDRRRRSHLPSIWNPGKSVWAGLDGRWRHGGFHDRGQPRYR